MNIKQITAIPDGGTDYTNFQLEDTTLRDQLSTKESVSNKTTNITSSSTDVQYPSAKATNTCIENNKSKVQVASNILQFINVKQ